MSLAVLASRLPNSVAIEQSNVVSKTFPDFWKEYARFRDYVEMK
jgi:5-enolpyruvylshikimate-3-phosphate synthase